MKQNSDESQPVIEGFKQIMSHLSGLGKSDCRLNEGNATFLIIQCP